MLKIEKFVTPSPEQWEITIEGMRNAMNSWDRMDSELSTIEVAGMDDVPIDFILGVNDRDLMMRLNKGGAPHAKYRRMLPVHVTVNAPLYWWKEFETYRIGVASNPSDIEFNSCSTMHRIHAKEFVLEDFSTEHLHPRPLEVLRDYTIEELNYYRDIFVNGGMDTRQDDPNDDRYAKICEPRDKDIWWQLIQLLPSSYNQKRTIYLNYQVLYEIYEWRRNHKLDEWHTFCHWIEELPYSELIIGGIEND